MFNLHLYESKMKTKTEIDEVKNKYITDQLKRKKKNEKLSQNYRKRCENFVLNMIEQPIKVTNYKTLTQKFRDENPEKCLGDIQTYIKGFKHEKDRIEESFQANLILDQHPNKTMANYQYRTRSIEKEIHADMRYTSKTSLERIQAGIKDRMQTQVENVDFRDEKKNKKVENYDDGIFGNDKVITASFRKRAMMARDVAKNLLPSLHLKTHFQAAQIMFNQQGLCLCDQKSKKNATAHPASILDNEEKSPENKQNLQPQLKSSIARKQDGMLIKVVSIANQEEEQQNNNFENTLNKIKSQQIESFNPIMASKKALQDCNAISQKNEKVKQLHTGGGHICGINDLTISEIYSQLYTTNHFVINNKPKLQKIQSSVLL